MKKRSLALIALLLVMVMTAGILSACKTPAQGGEETTETSGNTDETTGNGEDNTTVGDETTDGDETTVGSDVKLEGPYANLVENAHALKNGVTSYFTDPSREHYRVVSRRRLGYSLLPRQKGDRQEVRADLF